MRLLHAGRSAAFAMAVLVAGCQPQSAEPAAPEISFPSLEKEASGALLEALDGSMSRTGFEPLRAVSSAGLGYLKVYEGEVKCSPVTEDSTHCPYNDSSDYCTIGHGHLIAGKVACEDMVEKLTELGYLDGISDAESEALLRADLMWAQQALERQMDPAAKRLGTAELTDPQYDALVSFIFNVGSGNFSSSTLLKRLKARERVDGNVDIAGQFVLWKKSGGNVVQGLLNRRNKEVDQFFAGFERPMTARMEAEQAIDIRVGEPD